MDLRAWLDGIGLASYVDLFADNAIDMDVVADLTDDHLKELGLPLGHRLKLNRAIAELRGPAAEPAATAAGPAPDPEQPAPPNEAERRHLTVMMCDLVDSTGITARLDPEDMRELIMAYQNAVAGAIVRYEGHVTKFLGDGALAYFGWPRAYEDAPERALRAGLAIAKAVAELETPLGEPLAVRVGIATGLVVIGDLIGRGESQERYVVGDTPNLTARLQSIAGPGQVVIAEATRNLIGDLFELEEMGEHKLKGISRPVRVWRVVREGGAEGRFEALRGRTLMPLVGREEELELLRRRWETSTAGNGQVVLLSGEPGIGKSRLIRALLDGVPAADRRDVRMFCSHYHANSALHPTIEHFERAAHFAPEDSASQKLDKLEAFLAEAGVDRQSVLPAMATLLSIPPGGRFAMPDLEPRAQKAIILDTLVSLVEGFSRLGPILMVVEDAHWLDPTSIELLDLIIERIAGLRVFVLLSFRPEFTPRWMGPAHVSSLTLNRLGQQDGAAIIERVSKGKALPEEVRQHILSRTDGIPLFVEEMTRTVLETDLLADAGDHYELKAPLSAFSIPNSLQDSLMARLDRLAPAREVAQVASCIAREFDYGLLAAVAGFKTTADLDEALDALVTSELIFAHGVPPEATYKFKHALIQDAAYQTLLRSRRVVFHQRIAETLVEMFADLSDAEPELVAHHYTQAQLPEKAAEYWMRAGHKAMAGSGNLEAIEHFSQAVAQIGNMDPSDERNERELEALIALAVPLTSAKGYASAELNRTYSRARDLCREMGETPNLFPVLYGLWRYYLLRADYGPARELVTQLADLAERSGDPVFTIAAHRATGGTLFYLGEPEEALEHLQQVIDTPANDEARAKLLTFDVVDPWVASLAYAGWARWLLGQPDRARREADKAVEVAEAIGHRFSIALSKSFAAWTYQFCRDREHAGQLSSDVLAFSRENAFRFWIGWAEVLLGWASDDGEAGQSRPRRIRDGLADWRSTESRLGLSYFLFLLADVEGEHGQAAAALASLREAAAFAGETSESWWVPEIERLRCELQLSLGEIGAEDAMERLAVVLGGARSMKAKSLELRAAVSLARLMGENGHAEKAQMLLSGILERFNEGRDTGDIAVAQGLLTKLHAESAA